MCDATEGQMRIASARLSAGGAGEPAGDIWYYPPGVINRSRSAGVPIHNLANRIYLPYESIRSDVLFHELGHLAFGLGDQYDEQRRAGDPCGIGPTFDPGGLLDEANHTIVEQLSYQRCVTAGGVRTNRSCYDDPDLETGETCPLPDLSSEFGVPTNNDPLRGDDALPADICPDLAETFTRGERVEGCPVPEPGVVRGLTVGLGWLAGVARRRRAASFASARGMTEVARPASVQSASR